MQKGGRILLLSEGYLEMLPIWLGAWRIGAVVCPFNMEMNEKQMVPLTAALGPELIIYQKDIDVQRMVGDHRRRASASARGRPTARRTRPTSFCGAEAGRRRER